MDEKPSLEEVLKYAKPIIWKFIGKYVHDIPHEHKEEIQQEAFIKLMRAYQNLDAAKGWKSFTYNHCRGAVLDYMKAGSGFSEDKWSLSEEYERKKNEKPGIKHRKSGVPKMRERIFLSTPDGQETLDLDHVLGQAGIFSEIQTEKLTIRWEIIARLASQDDELLVFAKWLKGFSLDEVGAILGLSSGRIGQMIKNFVERFDDPVFAASPTFSQIIYALGLATHMGLKDCDQSLVYGIEIGQSLQPVDLDSDAPYSQESHSQLSLFSGGP